MNSEKVKNCSKGVRKFLKLTSSITQKVMATEQPASSEFLVFTLHRNSCTSPTWKIFPAQKNCEHIFLFSESCLTCKLYQQDKRSLEFLQTRKLRCKELCSFPAAYLPHWQVASQPAAPSLVVLTTTPCISFYRKETFPDSRPTAIHMQTKTVLFGRCSTWHNHCHWIFPSPSF